VVILNWTKTIDLPCIAFKQRRVIIATLRNDSPAFIFFSVAGLPLPLRVFLVIAPPLSHASEAEPLPVVIKVTVDVKRHNNAFADYLAPTTIIRTSE
jgi:hypothetical protein